MKFFVNISHTDYDCFVIEAEDMYEARALAEDKAMELHSWEEWKIDEVVPMKEADDSIR